MGDNRIEVWATGALVQGLTQEAVALNAAKAFPNASAAQLARFTSHRPFVVTRVADAEAAHRVIAVLTRVGVVAEVRAPIILAPSPAPELEPTHWWPQQPYGQESLAQHSSLRGGPYPQSSTSGQKHSRTSSMPTGWRALGYILGVLLMVIGCLDAAIGGLGGLALAIAGVLLLPPVWQLRSNLLPAKAGIVAHAGAVVLAFLLASLIPTYAERESQAQKEQEIRRAAAHEAELQQLSTKFATERDAVLADLRIHVAAGDYGFALIDAGKWKGVRDPELLILEKRAIAGFKAAVAAKTGDYAGLPSIPLDIYPELNETVAEANAVIEDLNCAASAICTGEKYSVDAAALCSLAIERREPARWDGGVARFRSYVWKGQGRSLITYAGHNLEIQNTFGAWRRHRYECDFAIHTKSLIDVRVAAY